MLFSRAFIADKRNGNVALLGLLIAAALATMAFTILPDIFLKLIHWTKARNNFGSGSGKIF